MLCSGVDLPQWRRSCQLLLLVLGRALQITSRAFQRSFSRPRNGSLIQKDSSNLSGADKEQAEVDRCQTVRHAHQYGIYMIRCRILERIRHTIYSVVGSRNTTSSRCCRWPPMRDFASRRACLQVGGSRLLQQGRHPISLQEPCLRRSQLLLQSLNYTL